MSAHTPGPWQVNHNDPFQVCDACDARGCGPIATMLGTAAEKRANARLIAAGPELLEALEAVVCAALPIGERGGEHVYHPAVTQARALLNRLHGGAA